MSHDGAKDKSLLDEEDDKGGVSGWENKDSSYAASTDYSYKQPEFSSRTHASYDTGTQRPATQGLEKTFQQHHDHDEHAHEISAGISTASISSTGSDPYYVNNLKSGAVWANSGTGVTINYKFWTSLPSYYSGSDAEASNFQAFTAAMKTATKEILAQISSITKIKFAEVSSDASAQLGFGQAAINPNAGAWAYYPSTSAKGGDVWTNNLHASQTQNMTKGGYGYFVLLHEIGHALGLKHSFEGTNKFTGEEDSSRYTVMSYTWPFYSISYMLYDIAALQSLYGSNDAYNTGDSIYALQAGKGYTIWDTGGTDTMDASAVSSASILDLREGHYSSVGGTKNIAIAYDVIIENATTGAGGDTIYDNEADNTINAGGGNDTVYFTVGSDTADGGDGTDTAMLAYRLEDYTLSLATDAMVILVNATTGTKTLENFEKFTFTNGTYTAAELMAFADSDVPVMTTEFRWSKTVFKNYSFTAGSESITSSDAGYKTVTGNLFNVIRTDEKTLSVEILNSKAPTDIRFSATPDGVDISLLGVNNKAKTTFTGGNGDDSYTVSDTIIGDDNVTGGDGNDTLNAGMGNDKIYGGAGADTVLGGGGNDLLYGGADNDTIRGGEGTDRIYGDAGEDELYGDAGNDTIYGGTENDILYGGLGTDSLFGDAGNDQLYGEDGNDTLKGGTGNDTLSGGTGNDKLYGEDGNDSLYGDDGNDNLYGGSGDDLLQGGNGSDVLLGDAGNDSINGGFGKDTLTGGAGVDTFVFSALETSVDAITDFTRSGTQADKIDIADVLSGFDPLADNINDFVQIQINNASKATLKVNADGIGSDWVTVATIAGKGLTGMTVDELFSNGQIVADH